jgi:hypothetical protein
VNQQQRAHAGRDIGFQEWEWTIQRVAWVVMTLIIVAAAIGLFGNGPLAETSRTVGDESVRAHYHRIVRHHQPRTLRVDVAPEAIQGGEVEVWLDSEYAKTFGLQSIIPEPESTSIERDRVVYTFSAGEGDGPLSITFFYENDGFWRQSARLGIVDGATVEFSQFVFP